MDDKKLLLRSPRRRPMMQLTKQLKLYFPFSTTTKKERVVEFDFFPSSMKTALIKLRLQKRGFKVGGRRKEAAEIEFALQKV